MPDREKVIKGLECYIGGFSGEENCKQCQYRPHRDGCKSGAIMDAIALLKAHEPKPVHVTAEINNRKIGECPNCSKVMNSGDYPNYCGQCGQAVKWE